ncbi:MAG: hypothetical protein ABSD20_20135 [Terriglobales bacterium]
MLTIWSVNAVAALLDMRERSSLSMSRTSYLPSSEPTGNEISSRVAWRLNVAATCAPSGGFWTSLRTGANDRRSTLTTAATVVGVRVPRSPPVQIAKAAIPAAASAETSTILLRRTSRFRASVSSRRKPRNSRKHGEQCVMCSQAESCTGI